jgi:hypothetical protein
VRKCSGPQARTSEEERRRMKSIGNAGAERLLSSSFQLSPLLPFSSSFFFYSSLRLGARRARAFFLLGPISLNSRGVHEVCEMAKRNPEVRKGRKRAMRAKTKGETYKRKTGTPRIRPRTSIVSSPLLSARSFILETRARYY